VLIGDRQYPFSSFSAAAANQAVVLAAVPLLLEVAADEEATTPRRLLLIRRDSTLPPPRITSQRDLQGTETEAERGAGAWRKMDYFHSKALSHALN
jgi:hypothetical protein